MSTTGVLVLAIAAGVLAYSNGWLQRLLAWLQGIAPAVPATTTTRNTATTPQALDGIPTATLVEYLADRIIRDKDAEARAATARSRVEALWRPPHPQKGEP